MLAMNMDLDPQTQNLINTKIVQKYQNTMVENLKFSYPLLSYEELNEAVQWGIANHHYIGKANLNNTYTKQCINGTTLDIIRFIESREPIITSFGVLYKKHAECDNPLNKMIQGFLKTRKGYKKQMFEYPKGSYMFEKYNLLQLLEKLNANATYGVLSAATSVFYNAYMGESITRQGRSYISASIMLLESFLANNVKFNSVDEIITFITNVRHERPIRKYNDSDYITTNITAPEAFYALMINADILLWVPSETEMCLVWDIVSQLDNEDLNRLYYKNNLYSFCDLPKVSQMIINILCTLDVPYMDPNNPPKEIQNMLAEFTSLLKEYVYYGYPYIDKLDRVEYMPRDIVALVD